MGHKIFVSYKYADDDVADISGNIFSRDTARTYVDKLAEYLSDNSEHIYKGEADGEDLSNLSEETIWKKLKDKIYDSTLTIVMISKGMRETYKPDKEQWIPWEISYSLKEVSRKNINGDPVYSLSNALLAIVIPDRNGSYDYYTYDKTCCSVGCSVFQTDRLFTIMRKNMFNIIEVDKKVCDEKSDIYYGDCSYMQSVKWEDFIKKPEEYIKKAYELRDNIADYDIEKEV